MTRVHDRLEELAAHHGLSAGAVERLGALLEGLATDSRAPTTVREPGRAVDIHIADSLSGLAVTALRSAAHIADLGAGAGFPGLALAAALPQTHVTLLEATGRKAAFIAALAAHAGIANASAVHARVEEWQDGMGACDVVTARALAPLDVLAEYAAPLLRSGGHFIAWKGTRDPDEEAVGAIAAEVVGLNLTETVPVEAFKGAREHNLYVYSKVRDTPDRFPRRPGMARKHRLSTVGRGS